MRLKSDAVAQTVFLLHKRNAGLLSGFARFPAKSILAKLLVPMQAFFVFPLAGAAGKLDKVAGRNSGTWRFYALFT
ncbi:hypothetical protein [Domibacillus tundrae]|uniref:hypothetical protein n=1 Tax=Domibacillus tundrae TaxID=1587527 RepID=UPI00069798D2|nr:hypothetical protein [Domibacillus tundrae]